MRVIIRADDGDEVVVEAGEMAVEQEVIRLEISNTAYSEIADYDSVTFSPRQARNLGRALLAAAELVDGAYKAKPVLPAPAEIVVNKILLS